MIFTYIFLALNLALKVIYAAIALGGLIGAITALTTRDDAFTAGDRYPKFAWVGMLLAAAAAVAVGMSFLSWVGLGDSGPGRRLRRGGHGHRQALPGLEGSGDNGTDRRRAGLAPGRIPDRLGRTRACLQPRPPLVIPIATMMPALCSAPDLRGGQEGRRGGAVSPQQELRGLLRTGGRQLPGSGRARCESQGAVAAWRASALGAAGPAQAPRRP